LHARAGRFCGCETSAGSVEANCDRRIPDNGDARRAPLQAETKTPSDPGKTENEGIQRILSKTVRQAGLILLFDGEVIDWLKVLGFGLGEILSGDFNAQHSTFNTQLLQSDEHSQTDILTSASNLIPPSQGG